MGRPKEGIGSATIDCIIDIVVKAGKLWGRRLSAAVIGSLKSEVRVMTLRVIRFGLALLFSATGAGGIAGRRAPSLRMSRSDARPRNVRGACGCNRHGTART
jgi:hypothetical protein